MTVFQAFTAGARRVHRAPAVLLSVWLLTILISPPLALTAPILTPLLGELHRPAILVGAASAYVALWLFLAGGILDRYARDRATRAHGFFGVTGVFFFRFLRLAVIMGAAYAILVGLIRPWLLARLSHWLTHDALDAVFDVLVAGGAVIFDYAQVRAVVEDRRSMIGAIGASVNFVRHAPAALALYVLDLALFLLLVAGYVVAAPEARGESRWLGFAIEQGYIFARVWFKLVFWASETALFQSRLAHAGYVAAPAVAWPESPAAEPFRN